MARTCSVCHRRDRAEIDAALVSKRPLREIAEQFGDLTISALSRHHRTHVGAQVVALRGEVVRAQRPLIERVEDLVDRCERLLESAESTGAVAQALAAVRELKGLYELVGRVTGELKPDAPTVAVNVLASPEILQLQQVLMHELLDYPELRERIAARWAALEAAS